MVDWEFAERIAIKMINDLLEESRAAKATVPTVLAAMLLVVRLVDESTENMGSQRPDNLVQFYGWAKTCFTYLKMVSPPNQEKPEKSN